jgi:hypothetical protein
VKRTSAEVCFEVQVEIADAEAGRFAEVTFDRAGAVVQHRGGAEVREAVEAKAGLLARVDHALDGGIDHEALGASLIGRRSGLGDRRCWLRRLLCCYKLRRKRQETREQPVDPHAHRTHAFGAPGRSCERSKHM